MQNFLNAWPCSLPALCAGSLSLLPCRFRAFVAEGTSSDSTLSGVVEVSLQSSQVMISFAEQLCRHVGLISDAKASAELALER